MTLVQPLFKMKNASSDRNPNLHKYTKLTSGDKSYIVTSFNANNDNFEGLYGSSFISDLQSITKSYIDWLGEMKRNKRSLDLFNLTTKDRPFDVVTGCKPKKVMSMKSDYDLVTDRLNSAVKKCNNKEDNNKFLEMFYLGLSKLVNEKFNS